MLCIPDILHPYMMKCVLLLFVCVRACVCVCEMKVMLREIKQLAIYQRLTQLGSNGAEI